MRQPLATCTYEAISRMVVHQSNRLHVGIDDRAADKAKAALFEILRECVTLRARGRDLRHACPAIHFLFSTDQLPDVAIE